jgi:hypothetical protein
MISRLSGGEYDIRWRTVRLLMQELHELLSAGMIHPRPLAHKNQSGILSCNLRQENILPS